MPRTRSTTAVPRSKHAKSYKHPESESPMRPEVGTQAEFKKKLPPKKYRYDDSLSPVLEWDGQNSARVNWVRLTSPRQKPNLRRLGRN